MPPPRPPARSTSATSMARVQVTPETFTLVEYDAGVIAGIAEELAALAGLPDDVAIDIDIDEELPLPLTGSTADVVDGRAVLWFSGADFEDTHERARFDEAIARTEIAMSLFRAADRLNGFRAAPVDEELTDAQRTAWEAWAEGRAVAVDGALVREPRRRYIFRLYNGFTDVADAAFDRLWSTASGELDWDGLRKIVDDCAAVDPRPKPKKQGVRKERLRRADA